MRKLNFAKDWEWQLVAIVLIAFMFGGAHRVGAVERIGPLKQTLRETPRSDGLPVVVAPGLDVTALSAINEAGEFFEIEGFLTMAWRDDRLELNEDEGPAYRHFTQEEIWTPPVEMVNAINYRRYSYMMTADRSGMVTYVERFHAQLSESFALEEFPFDQQRLRVVIHPFLAPESSIVFATEDTGSAISRESYARLAAWSIDDMTYVPGTVSVYSRVPQSVEARFDINVSRRSGFYIWKVFLPMIVMTIIPWSVFWVDVKELDWQMKIPIATMLALVAFEFAVARDLPRVPYVTFLDAVFLTSFMFVFVSIVEIVVVYHLPRAGWREHATRIHWHARWAVPLAYVSLLLILILIFFE